MVSHIKTISFQGVDVVPIDVQVHLAPGQNAFTVVGLPDKSVAESRERVRAALSAIGLALPYDRITINLSPADLAGLEKADASHIATAIKWRRVASI